jgi:hypothetical protein
MICILIVVQMLYGTEDRAVVYVCTYCGTGAVWYGGPGYDLCTFCGTGAVRYGGREDRTGLHRPSGLGNRYAYML